jgi:NADH dehydrogenase FAD-containing subunit
MNNTTFIQGKLTSIEAKNNTILILDPAGTQPTLKYEHLILALGNVIREIGPEQIRFAHKNPRDMNKLVTICFASWLCI